MRVKRLEDLDRRPEVQVAGGSDPGEYAVPKWRPFFYQCALVYRFLKPTEKFVFDRDGWKDRLCKLMGEIPQNPVFDAKARAAIPDNPATSLFWV